MAFAGKELEDQPSARIEQARQRISNGGDKLCHHGFVALGYAGQLRRDIAQHDRGLAAEPLDCRIQDLRLPDVANHHRRPGERLRLDHIDADHTPATANPFERHLHPGPRPGAKVQHPVPGTEHAESLVELDQLVGAPGAVTRRTGLAVLRVLADIAVAGQRSRSGRYAG